MLNLHQIKPSDFVETGSEKAILMNTKARRTYIKYFNKKMNTPIKTRSIGRAISFQKHVEVQARKIASLIQGKTDDYESFRMR
jgi:CRISPR/Cas system-associated endonuclease Cas1